MWYYFLFLLLYIITNIFIRPRQFTFVFQCVHCMSAVLKSSVLLSRHSPHYISSLICMIYVVIYFQHVLFENSLFSAVGQNTCFLRSITLVNRHCVDNTASLKGFKFFYMINMQNQVWLTRRCNLWM